MDLSVVVCAHNEERYLGEQLAAMVGQETARTWELIVVDNRSTDGTADLVESYARRDPRVRLVTADQKANQSYAMNVGVAAARAPRIAFCDGDDVVAPGWIEAVASGLETHQVVTGPHELDRLNPRWLADSRGRSIEQDPVGTFLGIFPTLRGASWGVDRRILDALGGMSEQYRACQDVDFSFRCWMRGIDIIGLPDAIVHYRYRSSTRDLWRQGFAYGSHRPIIARLVNESGRARTPRFSGWKSWAMLLVKLPMVLTKPGRASWVWIAANRLGQVVGSIRQRTIML